MSRERAKGTRAETAVVDYLTDAGFAYVERRAGNGIRDRGDIAGLPGVVLEVKNCNRVELAAWADELAEEMTNAGAEVGAVIHKRKGTTDVGRWYATLPVSVLAELLKEGR